MDLDLKKKDMETNSTYSNNNFQDELTLEKLNKIIKEINKIPYPYQEIAKSKGFDLDAGDQMFIPYEFAIAHKLPPRKNVHFHDWIKGIYLIKSHFRWANRERLLLMNILKMMRWKKK